ncbi:MAG: hypothetical protein WCK01_00410 [Candidatus Uhrbacteria bacterium]
MKKSNANLAVIPAPTLVSSGRRVLVQGADAGARHNIQALVDAAEAMPGEIAEVVYGDALFAHARVAAAQAAARGLTTRAVALTARDIERFEARVDLVMAHLDRAPANLATMDAAVDRGAAFVSYGFVQAPSMLAQGVMIAVEPGDKIAEQDARLYWETIGPITARRGSAAIFSEGAPEERLRETAVRETFRNHSRSVLKKLIAGLPLDVDPLQMTDGEDVYPLVVLPSDRWCTSEGIEQRVVHERHDLVLEPGSRMVIAECLSGNPPEIRFHNARFGRRDRRLTTRSSRTLTQADFEPGARASLGGAPDRSRGGDLGDALVGLALLAILLGAASRTSPVRTTD